MRKQLNFIAAVWLAAALFTSAGMAAYISAPIVGTDGPTNIKKICRNLNSKDLAIRTDAVHMLENQLASSTEHSAELNKCLASVSPSAAEFIVETARRELPQAAQQTGLLMAWVASPSAAPVMIKTLGHDKSPEMRKQAALSLGRIKTASAVTPLASAAAGDPDRYVRNCAIMALGMIGDKKSLPTLKRVLEAESDPITRKLATEAIDSITTGKEY